MRKISTIFIADKHCPDILANINKMAELENRKPHDSLQQFLRRELPKRIKELEK